MVITTLHHGDKGPAWPQRYIYITQMQRSNLKERWIWLGTSVDCLRSWNVLEEIFVILRNESETFVSYPLPCNKLFTNGDSTEDNTHLSPTVPVGQESRQSRAGPSCVSQVTVRGSLNKAHLWVSHLRTSQGRTHCWTHTVLNRVQSLCYLTKGLPLAAVSCSSLNSLLSGPPMCLFHPSQPRTELMSWLTQGKLQSSVIKSRE